ncbi:uncharacterized protein LY79DRAFT_651832 [Colletotrichum navitas]|uniref:Uncharacterized protein n=1 Tax=Colletotrichum navitas TaxID=681940 RepID=A0AAD8V1N5_9PEZI|nr:uncharacterized protein LY79DRAFT_651832 [Colletotrichum navitas]KAK1579952.1 hypothetical protein LY79DRAFT_651832 [Colletotrichum navitas]
MSCDQSQTRSHTLASSDIVHTNTAKLSEDRSVHDLGWNEKLDHDAKPWIHGTHNEDIWVLVRRLNKSVYEVKSAREIPYGGLDLTVAEGSENSPNKLRSEMERLYMGLVLGLFSFAKTTARLRSWREPRRTGVFCTVYFIAWLLDYLNLLFAVVVIALTLSPRTRTILFPPAPLAMVDIRDGSIAKPMGGILGSTDAATGAPQNLKGESVENEASNFITSVSAIATNLLTGKDPHGAPNEFDGSSEQGFKPQLDITTMAVVKDKAEGMDRPSQDKTKAPMEEKIWEQMTPLLHMIILISDVWERLSNILIPTPPFDQQNHKKRLAAYILPLAAASIFLSRDTVIRGTTLAFGVGIFGDPILTWCYHYANTQRWTESFHLNNTLFKGVPTNNQLALTLLRVGEANRAPVPPPAHMRHTVPNKSINIDDDDVISASMGDKPLGASQSQLENVAERDKEMADHAGGEDTEVQQAVGHGRKREKIFGLLKGGAKEVAKATSTIDKIRAKAGSENAKTRVGALPSSKDEEQTIGPVEFSARYEGKKGFVYVNAAAGFVVFNKNSITEENPNTVWTLNIDSITQLRKHSGYGMKAKLAAGWAVDGPIYDGLRIVDQEGNHFVVTALPYRDALFNRLCAIGKHTKWEVW